MQGAWSDIKDEWKLPINSIQKILLGFRVGRSSVVGGNAEKVRTVSDETQSST